MSVAVEPAAVAERVYPSFHVRYHLHFSTESRTIHSLEMKQQRKSLQYSSQIREDPTIVAFVVAHSSKQWQKEVVQVILSSSRSSVLSSSSSLLCPWTLSRVSSLTTDSSSFSRSL